MDWILTVFDFANRIYRTWLTIQGNPQTEEGRRQAFDLLQQPGEERITFNNFRKLALMLGLNLTDDQVQDAIQSIAGKGKQHLTWEQFNAFLAKKIEKKNKAWYKWHHLHDYGMR